MPNHAMLIAALVIGLLIVAQGIVGLVAPVFFLRLIELIQTPPNIYFAAVVRVAFGVVLVTEIILGWWSQGPGIVRAWATPALVLGLFIVYATAHKQRAA